LAKARGDAGADSDYDLMVVVPDDAPPERKRSRLAYEVLWGVGTAAEYLCSLVRSLRSPFTSVRLYLRLSCGKGGCFMPLDPLEAVEAILQRLPPEVCP
jgi:hypothetical protein